ncbi:branched-chain amino acid ABC transporter permease [Candidatus Bipolaricaulota bacterium]|nr:branched-chain amino acid ABC transporter permease [Candidatus Bipolaricaulota bacterium]
MFIQLVVSGVAIGAIYALVAIGFTLLWQASRTVNFAQGDFLTVSAVLMFILVCLGVPFIWALLITVVIAAVLLGFVVKKAIIQPLIDRSHTTIIVATIALSFLASNSVATFWSAQCRAFPQIFGMTPYRFGSIALSRQNVWTIIIAIGLILAINLFIQRTKPGKAMQAVAQNREAAKVLGINISRVTTMVFVMNAVIVVFAAMLIAPVFMVRFDMGAQLGLKAFYSAAIGGFNQIRGALLGGFLVGIIETFSSAYLSTEYREAFVLVVLIAVILIRKEGLLGTEER